MALVTVAATQMACSWDIEGNVARAEKLVRDAAAKVHKSSLIQELFQTPYFCIDKARNISIWRKRWKIAH